MFRLLRDDCFFINHHHHFRIDVPTIHFRQPNLTQFCLCCELCLLRCFGYLGTVLSTPTPCIVHHLTLHFCIAYSTTHHCHFHNPIELPQPPLFLYRHLTFTFGDFEFAVFPFPKVFRLLRDESPSSWYLHQDHRHSSSPRTVTSISSWYRGIPPLYIPLPLH